MCLSRVLVVGPAKAQANVQPPRTIRFHSTDSVRGVMCCTRASVCMRFVCAERAPSPSCAAVGPRVPDPWRVGECVVHRARCVCVVCAHLLNKTVASASIKSIRACANKLAASTRARASCHECAAEPSFQSHSLAGERYTRTRACSNSVIDE